MNNLSNPNSYIKKISVDLMAYDCVFKDVETKQLRKLNFYEKTIIMLLVYFPIVFLNLLNNLGKRWDDASKARK